MDYEGGRSEHLNADICASYSKRVTFSPQILVLKNLNLDDGGGRGPDSETNLKGTEHSSAEIPDSSDTVSSSSSKSSFDDFIPVSPQILQKYRGENITLQPNMGTKPSCKNEKSNVTSEELHRLEESINESPESTSQLSDVTHESLVEYMSPTLSPSIQMMEWPEALDPKRNPTSTLQRPPRQKEGSATSDDSLFSIRIGEAYNPGELSQPGELHKCRNLQSNSRPVISKETTGETVNTIVDESINDVSRAGLMSNQVDTKIEGSRNSSIAKHQSDKIEASIQSFASPIKKKSLHPLCHCPGCSPAFRCCKWPSCCCKWSGCSSQWFHWPRCSKWFIWTSCSRNCLSWQRCCCKWPSCHCKCPNWSSCCFKCPSWPCC